MSVSVTMPRLGESVTEGTVTRWLKKEGERVEADEPLLEVSTDKVDTEIPAPASGTLSAIRVGEDETVEVGVELAVIDEAGSGAAAEAPAQGQPAQDEAPAAPEAPQQAEPEPEPRGGAPAAGRPGAGAAGRPAGRTAAGTSAAGTSAAGPAAASPPQQTSQQQAPPAARTGAQPAAPARLRAAAGGRSRRRRNRPRPSRPTSRARTGTPAARTSRRW